MRAEAKVRKGTEVKSAGVGVCNRESSGLQKVKFVKRSKDLAITAVYNKI